MIIWRQFNEDDISKHEQPQTHALPGGLDGHEALAKRLSVPEHVRFLHRQTSVVQNNLINEEGRKRRKF